MSSPAEGFCSSMSREVDEQLFATVSQTQYWLLLEYPSAWGTKAFEESQIPEAVKTYLSAFLDNTHNSRLLLIKGTTPAAPQGIHLYLVNSLEQDPQIFQFLLDRLPGSARTGSTRNFLRRGDLPQTPAPRAALPGLYER